MKIGIVLVVLIIIYIFYSKEPPPPSINNLDVNQEAVGQVPDTMITNPPSTPPPPDPKLLVDVFYECLCPDSRYFVLHHLLPTVNKVGSLMEVRLWPYGKATSHKTDTGTEEIK